jgi:acyl-CoA dehydrogenase
MMVDTMRRWLSKHYSFDFRQQVMHTPGGCSASAWSGLAELGITSLTIPEALGGMEQPMTDLLH